MAFLPLKKKRDQGDGSTQTCAAEVSSQHPHEKLGRAPVTPALGNERPDDTWDLVVNQSNQMVSFRLSEERGWRDGSAGKSTGCSSRGPGFNSQHAHGSSQLSVTPGSNAFTKAYKQAKHQYT